VSIELANKPAVDGRFCVVIVPTTYAGVTNTDRNLMDEVQAKIPAVATATGLEFGGTSIKGLLVGNHQSANTAYVKTTTGAADTKGIPVTAGSTLYLPISDSCSDALLYECDGDISVGVFY